LGLRSRSRPRSAAGKVDAIRHRARRWRAARPAAAGRLAWMFGDDGRRAAMRRCREVPIDKPSLQSIVEIDDVDLASWRPQSRTRRAGEPCCEARRLTPTFERRGRAHGGTIAKGAHRADPIRLQLVSTCCAGHRRAGVGCVRSSCPCSNVAQGPTLSHHLKKLREAGHRSTCESVGTVGVLLRSSPEARRGASPSTWLTLTDSPTDIREVCCRERYAAAGNSATRKGCGSGCVCGPDASGRPLRRPRTRSGAPARP